MASVRSSPTYTDASPIYRQRRCATEPYSTIEPPTVRPCDEVLPFGRDELSDATVFPFANEAMYLQTDERIYISRLAKSTFNLCLSAFPPHAWTCVTVALELGFWLFGHLRESRVCVVFFGRPPYVFRFHLAPWKIHFTHIFSRHLLEFWFLFFGLGDLNGC